MKLDVDIPARERNRHRCTTHLPGEHRREGGGASTLHHRASLAGEDGDGGRYFLLRNRDDVIHL